MKYKVWDIYASNCFVYRVHYMGFKNKVIDKWKELGYNVTVEEKEIEY